MLNAYINPKPMVLNHPIALRLCSFKCLFVCLLQFDTINPENVYCWRFVERFIKLLLFKYTLIEICIPMHFHMKWKGNFRNWFQSHSCDGCVVNGQLLLLLFYILYKNCAKVQKCRCVGKVLSTWSS